jgi:hypothetical protein
MAVTWTFMTVLSFALAAAGRVYDGRARQLDVAIPRIDASATVDGRLDEPVWREAALLTGFSQYRPVDGLPAADSTEVLVWYAPGAIYFGIRAFEAHGAVVRATVADRDAIDADDNVQILLDTYDDRRRAFEFAVNPLGIQADGVRSEGQDAGAAGGGNAATGRFDGVIDLNPDFVWESRGHVTPWGYEVEVRIPMKSLRYQSATPQDWGLQIVRQVQHSGYEDTWTPVVRASASFLAQAGRLVGLRDLHRGIVMDVNPELTTKVAGAPETAGYAYHTTPEVGGTLHWGLTSNLSLSATAHPDYSQIEADVPQVTVNQRFALFYPEKRTFFLDGLEQYDTPNRLIYTRQIVQPVAGAKLIGKLGATNFAYLGAVDRVDPMTGDNPVFNILRLRHDLGAGSTLGLVYTDRIEGSAYNRVAGGDARILWRKIWFSQIQVVQSWTNDGTDAFGGTLWDIVLGDRTGRSYGNHFEVNGVTSAFVAASGFVNRTGIVSARLFNRFTWYGAPGALVEEFSTFVMLTPLWRYDDFWHARSPIEGGLGTLWTATLRGGWNVNATLSDNLQRFDSTAYGGYAVNRGTDTIPFVVPRTLYHLGSGSVGFSTPNRAVTLSGSATYGAAPIFAEAATGRELSLTASLAWHPIPTLRGSATWVHDHLFRAAGRGEFALTNIPRLEVDYQMNRYLFVRYIGQYVAQRQAAPQDAQTGGALLLAGTAAYAPLPPVSSNTFDNYVLLSYKPSPGTVVFLGYGTSLTEPDAFAFSRTGLTRTSDGVFVKASYSWRP